MQALQDEEECARVVLSVADSLDSRDDRRLGEHLRFCNWTVAQTGQVFRGTRGAEQLSHEYLGRRLTARALQHDVTNILVDVDPDRESATATSVFAVLARVGGHLAFVLAGHYEDSFRRENGRWHLRERVECWELSSHAFERELSGWRES